MKIRIDKQGITVFFSVSKDGESWSIARVGEELEHRACGCEHDCCGHTFTQYAYREFFGIVQIMRYGINV